MCINVTFFHICCLQMHSIIGKNQKQSSFVVFFLLCLEEYNVNLAFIVAETGKRVRVHYTMLL